MQTFLPYADFKRTVECLDYRRLGKQRLEAKQIFNIITGRTDKKGWVHHPAVLMWRGFPDALAIYHNSCIMEWVIRGYNNTMDLIVPKGEIVFPPWFGNEKFHSSHRQTLLQKNYEWYSQFGWEEEPKYEYWWPTKNAS